MKPRSTIYLAIAVVLGLSTGCTLLRSAEPSPEASVATPTESATPSPVASLSSNRPDTRVMPMTIEGRVLEIEMRLFDQQPLPFTTYVPIKDFQTEVNRSDQGTVAQFFFSPKGKKDSSAYVQIFLPTRQTSVEDMRSLLLDEGGLLAANDWKLVDRTDIVSYPWAEEKLIYQHQVGKDKYLGSIYIGDYEGKSFYALTHYPAEYIDGFEPRSTIMLENLQFRDQNSF